MRISELLYSIAEWLESPNNEALMLAEDNEECAKIVAENCVLASALLKNAAEQVDELEPVVSKITPEAIDDLAKISEAFDSSNDPKLKKQAAVIDELLLSIAAPPDGLNQIKKIQEARLEEIKKKYNSLKEKSADYKKIVESEKALKDSKMMKEYNIFDAPLSTRYCPDHAGVQISRVGEHLWQCELDKKTYDFEKGFTLNNGKEVPPHSITANLEELKAQPMFDTRLDRMQTNKP